MKHKKFKIALILFADPKFCEDRDDMCRFVGCDEWGYYRCELFNEDIYREDDGFLLKLNCCPAFKK